MKHKYNLIEHLFSATLAAGLVVVCLAAYSGFVGFLNRPDAFMMVSITVPDHKQGDDPAVLYERLIRRQASGIWVVEIQCNDCILSDQCSGTGNGIYNPIETGKLYMSLSKYSGTKCELEPGRYTMLTYWNLTDRDGNTATVSNETEPFKVLPK